MTRYVVEEEFLEVARRAVESRLAGDIVLDRVVSHLKPSRKGGRAVEFTDAVREMLRLDPPGFVEMTSQAAEEARRETIRKAFLDSRALSAAAARMRFDGWQPTTDEVVAILNAALDAVLGPSPTRERT